MDVLGANWLGAHGPSPGLPGCLPLRNRRAGGHLRRTGYFSDARPLSNPQSRCFRPQALFLELEGNRDELTKTLFRDRLGVQATPALFLFKNRELLHMHASGSPSRLEKNVRLWLEPHECPTDRLYAE